MSAPSPRPPSSQAPKAKQDPPPPLSPGPIECEEPRPSVPAALPVAARQAPAVPKPKASQPTPKLAQLIPGNAALYMVVSLVENPLAQKALPGIHHGKPCYHRRVAKVFVAEKNLDVEWPSVRGADKHYVIRSIPELLPPDMSQPMPATRIGGVVWPKDRVPCTCCEDTVPWPGPEAEPLPTCVCDNRHFNLCEACRWPVMDPWGKEIPGASLCCNCMFLRGFDHGQPAAATTTTVTAPPPAPETTTSAPAPLPSIPLAPAPGQGQVSGRKRTASESEEEEEEGDDTMDYSTTEESETMHTPTAGRRRLRCITDSPPGSEDTEPTAPDNVPSEGRHGTGALRGIILTQNQLLGERKYGLPTGATIPWSWHPKPGVTIEVMGQRMQAIYWQDKDGKEDVSRPFVTPVSLNAAFPRLRNKVTGVKYHLYRSCYHLYIKAPADPAEVLEWQSCGLVKAWKHPLCLFEPESAAFLVRWYEGNESASRAKKRAKENAMAATAGTSRQPGLSI